MIGFNSISNDSCFSARAIAFIGLGIILSLKLVLRRRYDYDIPGSSNFAIHPLVLIPLFARGQIQPCVNPTLTQEKPEISNSLLMLRIIMRIRDKNMVRSTAKHWDSFQGSY